jgi:hypothetical protein
MRSPGVLFIALASLTAPLVRADEARIPIYQATTIGEAGHYILTRDVSVTAGAAIVIHANDVTVDLNGHVISSSSTTDDDIRIDDGFTDVAIRNGKLSGGRRGISYESLGPGVRARIESVQVINTFDTGIQLTPGDSVEVIRCLIQNPGIGTPDSAAVYVNGIPNHAGGRVIDNQVVLMTSSVDGLFLGVTGGVVRGNSVITLGSGLSTSSAITAGGTAVSVEENRVTGGTFSLGAINVSSNQGRIMNNTIQTVGGTTIGIWVQGDDNLIGGNVINAGGTGITIEAGNRNLMDGNVVQGAAACGLSLGTAPSATLSMYRNNALKGNGTAVCSAGNGFNAGGNICNAGFCP